VVDGLYLTPEDTMNMEHEVAALRLLTIVELRRRYAQIVGEATESRHREHLIRRIAWHLQAKAEGGLSQRALRRATELAQDADLRLTAPKPPKAKLVVAAPSTGERIPPPGTVLKRPYKGQDILVTVRTDGFEYLGEVYRSLSAIARTVTGTHWNGLHFFGLGRRQGGGK
jgi:hypothetical protein